MNLRFGAFLTFGFLVAFAPARSAQSNALSVVQSCAVIERGWDYRIWQVARAWPAAAGQVLEVQTNYYTELQTGLNYMRNGQWLDSAEKVVAYRNGPAASQGPHTVLFGPNLLSPPSAVTVIMVDGTWLPSTPSALVYHDPLNGTSVTIATVQDCPVEVLPPNQVIYRNAFANLTADIRYTYTRAGLEQDVILRSNLPSPARYGLNPATTRLEVWTEFLQGGPSQRTVRVLKTTPLSPGNQPMAEPVWEDEELVFGAMRLVRGRAFALEGSDSLPVAKRWQSLNERNYLVEAVEFSAIQPLLAGLPGGSARSSSGTRMASAGDRPGSSAPLPPAGVVIDYLLVNHQANFTFQGDRTYYVSGTVYLSGTTVVEGGTVIKYTNSPSARLHVLEKLDTQTMPYRPAIFTAQDDDTVGVILPESSGAPAGGYGAPAVALDHPGEMRHVQFRFAQTGLAYDGGSGYQLRHAQLVSCQNGVRATDCEWVLRNVLFHQVKTNFSGNNWTGRGEHLTVDGADCLSRGAAKALFLTNSLLVSVVDPGNFAGQAVRQAASGTGVFIAAGAGWHYLPDSSPYRNAGTAAIDPALAEDLRQRTTAAPQIISGEITGTSAWVPQVARDTDAPDLGYHYEPLDYVCGDLSVRDGTLSWGNGVAVGVYGVWGVRLGPGAQWRSEGRPLAPNRLVRYMAVQEEPIGWGATGSRMGMAGVMTSNAVLPLVRLRFTQVSELSGERERGNLLGLVGEGSASGLVVTDSQLQGCHVAVPASARGAPGTEVAWTNNLVQACHLEWEQDGAEGAPPLGLQLWNNLFLGGSIRFTTRTPNANWAVLDNVFDGVDLTVDDQAFPNSNNGYVTTSPLPGSGPNIVVARFNYAIGPLGNYYQASTNFIDQGSRTADMAGLARYTTTPGLVEEGSSVVDLGLHYLANPSAANTAPVLIAPPDQRISALNTLTVTNAAIDADVPAQHMIFSLVLAPAGASFDAVSGILVWTPTAAQAPSTNVITVRVTDDGSPNLSDTKSFNIIVVPPNHPPVLTIPADQTIDELTLLTVTNAASDPDGAAARLTFGLVAAPAGVSLDPATGVLAWTPSEEQGPGTYSITVRVSDDGTPPLSDVKSFSVHVNEVNRPPVLSVPTDRNVTELSTLVVANAATDPDLPSQQLTFTLESAPAGMVLDSVTGILTWTPATNQAPSTNVITIRVTDNGTPNLSDVKSFAVTVLKRSFQPPTGPLTEVSTNMIVAWGANYRKWRMETSLVNTQGQAVASQTNSFTELHSGLHYYRGGQWLASVEEIVNTPSGPKALNGPHRASFSPNLDPAGVVTLVTPDSQPLISTPSALVYHDAATGASATLASAQSSAAEVLPPNQVIYRKAFNNIAADIRYTYTRGGFEQDVILRSDLPSPARFGLSPATTRLEIWTEFPLANPPQKIGRVLASTPLSPSGSPMAEPVWDDEELVFGAMRMVRGRAFQIGAATDSTAGVPVAKHWRSVDGRNYLVESVDYAAIAPWLDGLTGIAPSARGGPWMAMREEPGVVLDYLLVNNAADFTFSGDQTYYVSGTVYLSGTTTLEGGAVIKYANSPAARLNVLGTLDCQATAYRPVIFTAKDDDTVGLRLPASTGNPAGSYGYPDLSLDYPAQLAHVRMRHAAVAMALNGGTDYQISHAQLVNCANGFSVNRTEFALRNLLLDHVQTNFIGSSSTGRCEHLTVDAANWFNHQACTALYLTNSLLVGVANPGLYEGVAVSRAGNGDGVFTTVGAGSHYLSDNRYRNAGTTNINPDLATELRLRTSYPPLVLTGDLAGLTTLSPQAWRDGDVPDLGYHYEPLDYVCQEVNLSGGAMVWANGAAIGTCGRWGVNLQSGAQLRSEGQPLALNHLVRYTAVQEKPVTWGAVAYRMGLLAVTNDYDELPSVRLRCTAVSVLSDEQERRHLLSLDGNTRVGALTVVDSQWHGCRLAARLRPTDGPGMEVALTNNLVQWADIECVQGEDANPAPLGMHLWNNLFRKSRFYWADWVQNARWEVKDNLFDEVVYELKGIEFANSNNGYLNTPLMPGSGDNVVLTSFSFSPGPLGGYYQQSTDLIDRGSRLATAAGLPNYTTQTNQAQEGSSRVDIGLHYLSWNAATNADLPAQVNTAPVLTGPRDLIITFPGTLVLTNRATDADLPAQRLTFNLVTAPDGMSLDSASGVVRWTPGAGQTPGTNLVTIRVADDGTPSLSDVKSFKATVMEPGRLGYWRFDDTNSWAGENGQQPVEVLNVAHVPSFSGGALQVMNPDGRALIRYRVQETNGQFNTFPQSGSIRFVFRPAWTSRAWRGPGPGELVRLWELGDLASPAGGAALSVTADGNNLVFTSKDNAGNSFETSGAYNFVSNTWYDITLGLRRAPPNASNRVKVTVFEATVINRDGMSFLPFPSADNGSFTIGSSPDGSRQARGMFDELETVNYDFSDISWRMSYQAMSARVSASPPQISLRWRRTPNATTEICRKRPSETAWKSLAHTAGWSYTDAGPDLQIGQRYDYQLLPLTSHTGQSEITVGLNLPPVERRGRVVLLVDTTVAASLSASLEQLTKDLVGEGWIVLRHDVPRHVDFAWYDGAFNASYTNNVAAIKALINADYLAAPAEVKAVFIIGHVTVPYSGANAEDGHVGAATDPVNHYGAWPTDAYYGDVDGVWTDQLVRYTNAFNPILQNLAGDGKWDANAFPSSLEMAVGRVDFARMPAFDDPNNGLPRRSEVDLLNQYLAKAHRYRNHLIALPERAVVMGYYSGALDSENAQIYAEAIINSTRCFGFDPGSVLYGDLYQDKLPALWGFQSGFATGDRINNGGPNQHSASDLAPPSNEPPIAFYVLDGSYFGDWNLENNFLRAALATPNYGLVALYTRRGTWRLNGLALGDTFGEALLQTANDSTQTRSVRTTALLGDPTLRLKTTPAVASLTAQNLDQTVALVWNPAADPNTQYLIYRSSNPVINSAGDFESLTPVPTTMASFVDHSPPAGPKTYLVRPVNLVTTGSGSYTNLGPGAFVRVE